MKPRTFLRRATTDDLPQLEALWQAADFPVKELGRQLTDFQVAVDEEGRVTAAVALRISSSDGEVHSETFLDFGRSESLRPLLWERLEIVAKNHSLFRLWTRETAPFWRKAAGFGEASPELMAKLPPALGAPGPGWFALRLKEEGADPAALDLQFQIFKHAEDAKRERIYARARILRTIGTIIAVAIFVLGFIILLHFARHRSR